MTTQFTSAEMEQFARVTARQLQWWDERKLVQPEREGARRVYSAEQAFRVLVVAELRHKGLSLQKIRHLMRAIQKRIAGRAGDAMDNLAGQRLWLVTDGRVASFVEEGDVLAFLTRVRRGVHIVSLSDNARRVKRPYYEVARKKAS